MMSKSPIRTTLVSLAMLLVLSVWAMAAPYTPPPSHMDELKNPEGCSACHGGRGIAGTPMLKEGLEDICFRCHGDRGRGKSQHNLEDVFGKRSIHPVLTTGLLHRASERLPESDPNAERHVSCFDCHRAHVTRPENPAAGIKGYSPGPARADWASGRRFSEVTKDYELCYLCHAASANLPSASSNKALEFNPDNPSFHPLEAQGRNSFVPSLRGGLRETDRIRCGSCHGNDEVNGPQGPHGSDHEPLLIAEYRTVDGAESALDYELCYICHERRSILNDESFKRHNLHINQQDTACFTCHDSHGSIQNVHLIGFNPDVVVASDVSGGPSYQQGTQGNPQCFLKCHGIDHNINGIGGKPWPY